MIECEVCGSYHKPDDIENCPECDLELCPSCYNKHIINCFNTFEDDDEYEDRPNFPSKCPVCGEALELDLNPIENGGISSTLICQNYKCDYSLDITEEISEDEEEDNNVYI